MKRYVTRGKSADDWDYREDTPPRTSIDVWQREDKPRPTGLLDAAGNELYSVETPTTIGFVRFQ